MTIPVSAEEIPYLLKPLAFLSWGVRRADGEPWPDTDPTGGTAYWSRGSETTLDGMVLIALDFLDCVACVYGQNVDDEGALLPGEVVPVWLKHDRDGYAWHDVPMPELLSRARSTAAQLSAYADRFEEATARA